MDGLILGYLVIIAVYVGVRFWPSTKGGVT